MFHFAMLPFGLIAAILPCLIVLFVPRRFFIGTFAVLAVLALWFTLANVMTYDPCSGDGCIAYSIVDGIASWATLFLLLCGALRWFAGRDGAGNDNGEGE